MVLLLEQIIKCIYQMKDKIVVCKLSQSQTSSKVFVAITQLVK